MSNLCPYCRAWRTHPQDRFCGLCGELLIRPDASLTPHKVFVGQRPPTTVGVHIRNKVGSLGGTTFLLRDATGQIPDYPIKVLGPDDMTTAGDPLEAEVPGDALGLSGEQPREWHLILLIDDRQAFVLATLHTQVVPPVLDLAPSALETDESGSRGLDFVLRQTAGDPVTVNGLALMSQENLAVPMPAILTDPPLPTQLRTGASIGCRIDARPDFLRLLLIRPLGLSLALEIDAADRGPGATRLALHICIRSPARIHLTAPETQVRGIVGGSLRLPLSIENLGGSPCRIKDVKASIQGTGGLVLERQIPAEGAGVRLDAGQRLVRSIAVPLQDEEGTPLPKGLYRCLLTQEFADGPPEATVEVEVEVRPPSPFRGVVAIDFGTTATAAAYYTPNGHFRHVPLDPVDSYAPTAIAYFLNAKGEVDYTIGRAAREMLANHRGRVAYFDNIKVRLHDPSRALLPDNSPRDWIDVAADYLRKVKELVEEDQSIAASVDQVCITRPARFDPRSTKALIEAYRRAGMGTRTYVTNGTEVDSLSEAWPSAVLALPGGGPELGLWQREAIGDTPLFADKDFGRHYLLCYDVGGGSTDLSLLAIDIQDQGRIEVTELASDGTTLFCGNHISQTLFDHLWPSCEEWLRRQGRDPAHVPIRLPWQEVRTGDSLAEGNGRRFAEVLVYPLQCLESVHYDKIAGDAQGPKIWLDWDAEAWKALEKALPEYWGPLAEALGRARDLTVTDRFGQEVQIPIDASSSGGPEGAYGVRLDLVKFTQAYVTRFSRHMYEVMERMLRQIPGPGNGAPANLSCLIAGRGSLFPLVTAMIFAHVERLESTLNLGRIAKHRVGTRMTKTYVPTGACHIDRALLGGTAVRFSPLPCLRFGVYGRPDKRGRRQFIPLVTGFPDPGDDPVQEPYPLEPGPSAFWLEFGLAGATEPLSTTDFRPLGSVEVRLDLSPSAAAAAQLRIEALDRHRVQVQLLTAATGGHTPAPDDDPDHGGTPATSPPLWEPLYDAILQLEASD